MNKNTKQRRRLINLNYRMLTRIIILCMLSINLYAQDDQIKIVSIQNDKYRFGGETYELIELNDLMKLNPQAYTAYEEALEYQSKGNKRMGIAFVSGAITSGIVIAILTYESNNLGEALFHLMLTTFGGSIALISGIISVINFNKANLHSKTFYKKAKQAIDLYNGDYIDLGHKESFNVKIGLTPNGLGGTYSF